MEVLGAGFLFPREVVPHVRVLFSEEEGSCFGGDVEDVGRGGIRLVGWACWEERARVAVGGEGRIAAGVVDRELFVVEVAGPSWGELWWGRGGGGELGVCIWHDDGGLADGALARVVHVACQFVDNVAVPSTPGPAGKPEVRTSAEAARFPEQRYFEEIRREVEKEGCLERAVKKCCYSIEGAQLVSWIGHLSLRVLDHGGCIDCP